MCTSRKSGDSGRENGKPKRFRDRSFVRKVRKYAARAGARVIETAWTLYLVWQDPDTPRGAKLTIAGAIAYFVLLLDVVPDFLPGGFADDLGVLLAALAKVAASIKGEHREQAKGKVCELFGNDCPGVGGADGSGSPAPAVAPNGSAAPAPC